MMRRSIIDSLIISILLLSAAQLPAQDNAAGKLLFKDAIVPIPAGPGKVAFFRSDRKIPGNPIEMYLGDIKTGDETRALPGHNFRKDPALAAAWSPDGSHFVIQDKVEGNWELFMYEKGGRSGKVITDMTPYRVDVNEQQRMQLDISAEMQLSFADLRYSSSGDRLIFTLSRLGKTAIWWHDLNTGNSRQATEDRTGYSGSFFPDDEHFCYTLMVRKGGDISSDEDIIRQSIKTGVADTLISTRDHEHDPDVSPNGKYVLFTKRVDGVNNLFVMNIATGVTRQFTFAREGQHCSLGRWSSDGKMVYLQGAGFYPKPAVFGKEFEPF